MTTAQAQSLLKTVAAEREIYSTYLRVFELVDGGESDRAAVECFTPDAEIEFSMLPGPAQRFENPAAFTDFIGTTGDQDGQMVAHVAGQYMIDWQEERPTLSGYATVWHWFRSSAWLGESRPADWTSVSLVEDEYERPHDRWLISHRRISSVAGIVAAGTPPLMAGFRRG